MFVFDKRGEVVYVADFSDRLVNREPGISIPDAFVEIVEEALKVKTSLDDCERGYLESGGSSESFRQLQKKLNQFEQIGAMRVVKFLRDNADSMESPALTKYHALLLEWSAIERQEIDKNAIDAFANEIEQFWIAFPDFKNNSQLIKAYLNDGLAYTFDVRTHCQELIDKWSEAGSPGSLSILAESLTEECEKYLEEIRSQIADLKSSKDFRASCLYALTGNIEMLREALGHRDRKRLTSQMQPIFDAWQDIVNQESGN